MAHENGPDLTSLAAITGSVGPSPYEGTSRASPHAPQAAGGRGRPGGRADDPLREVSPALAG